MVEPWTPYCGAAPVPGELLTRWNLDPWLLAALAATAALLAARSRRPVVGLSGLCVVAVVFVSPLCALSSALFAARTVHHVLLVAVAAPMLALSLPPAPRSGVLGALSLQAATFWAWHAPAAYGWALSHDAVYWVMQATLLGSALWFWSAVLAARALAAAGALLLASIAMGLLGAVLTFSQHPFYAPHATSAFAWGVSPLEDQQIAGLIMWVPAAGIYLLVALGAVRRLLIAGPAAHAT